MTMRRAWLGTALLFLASVTIACGLSEVYLRLFRPQPLQAAYLWPDGTVRHRPSFRFVYTRREFSSTVTYNAHGMRGPEIAEVKTPGVPRVLFLGDSFVEGKQVEDHEVLTEVMSRLAAERGAPMEVVNLGVAGYGTGEQLLLWDKLGKELDPDLVLLGFFPNDVRNNAERGMYAIADGGVVMTKDPRRKRARWWYAVRKYLAAHSHSYMLAKLGMDEMKARLGGTGERMRQDDVLAQTVPDDSDDWPLTLALLEELNRRVTSHGARFVVVDFPTRHQVDDALWVAHARGMGIDPEAVDRDRSRRELASWSERTGIPVIELQSGFRDRNRSNSFYFEFDGHWNPAGHRLAAELILDALHTRSLTGS